MNAPILSLPEVAQFSASARANGKVVVTTNGVFDLFSIPHLRYIEAAKREGDILLVGINSDMSVKVLKGPKRPIVSELDRATIVAAIRAVDAVFLFDDTDPRPWLPLLQPHVHVNAAEYTAGCIESATVATIGARLTLVGRHTASPSTSDYIAIILDRYAAVHS